MYSAYRTPPRSPSGPAFFLRMDRKVSPLPVRLSVCLQCKRPGQSFLPRHLHTRGLAKSLPEGCIWSNEIHEFIRWREECDCYRQCSKCVIFFSVDACSYYFFFEYFYAPVFDEIPGGGEGGGWTMQNKEIHMVKKKNDVHDKLLASFRRHSFIERIWAHSGGTVSLIGLRSGCRIFLIRPDLGWEVWFHQDVLFYLEQLCKGLSSY